MPERSQTGRSDRGPALLRRVEGDALRERDQDRRLQLARRRTGIRPPAPEDVEPHGAGADVGVVDVGYLELSASRGLEACDDRERLSVVHVAAGHDQIALRPLRLLLDLDDLLTPHGRDTEPARVMRSHALEQDAGAAALLL